MRDLKSENLNFKLLFFIFIVIFFKSFNFFKNSYDLIYTNYDTRLQEKSYSHCLQPGNKYSKDSGAGYIFKIKEKFKLKYIPKIINYHSVPDQRWIFHNLNTIDENKIILLFNYDDLGSARMTLDNYKVLDNFQNNCYFLEKRD